MHSNFTPLFVLGESVFNSDMIQIGTISRPKQANLRLISSNGQTLGRIEVPPSFKVNDLQALRAWGVAKMEVVA